jgi:cellulose synthase/poly-beta-1,6-N-acetylglucosamine synthase-like glycosyltransferase
MKKRFDRSKFEMMNMLGPLFWLSVFFVIYVYVGYPLILTLFARLRRNPVEYPVFLPKVTLLIAAYNEQDVIATKLENALALDYPRENLQILVAADGSDDRTVEIVEGLESRGVELSYQPERHGKMAAINRAMSKARHEIVLFSDANNLYNQNTLRELVKPFSNARVGAVSGSKNIIGTGESLAKADSLYWRYESYIKVQETRLGSCTGVSGEILAVRNSLYQPPPDQVINDDFFIALGILRQGYRIVYRPYACSFERSSLTEKDESLRRSRIVAGRYQAMLMSAQLLPWRNPLLVWQIVSHKFLRPLVPLAMIVAFVANLVVLVAPPASSADEIFYLAQPFGLVMLILQLIFYGCAWLGNILKSRGAIGKVLYVPAFLVNSNLSAIRGLVAYFTGRQTSLWKRARREELIVE